MSTSGANVVHVPDLDKLPRGVRSGWRQVADAVLGRHDPLTVAERIEKAAARSLRSSPDIEGLFDLADALDGAWRAGSTRPVEAVVSRLGCRATTGVLSAFVDKARSLAAGGPPALGPLPDPLGVLAESGIERMAWKLCLGPLEPTVTPRVFVSNSEFVRYADDCLRQVRVGELGRRLTEGGCTGDVRAPRTRRKRRSTAELLHESLD